ncbi:death domain-associated protein 6 isoform X2 [Clupea harengus]|uniref:Death domain-associated protein 6 n=1 Tax=Clupea harengus TaxID=7950 RepID=A0A8M1KHP8_CLUHA|nr:death domain-associated protein 6 isoform X2 [Clupea harengus]
MDSIIILDDDEEEEKSEPSSSISPRSSAFKPSKNVQAPTHITQSPFASAKKDSHVLQKENETLFAEFVEHCKPHTTDCSEVLTFLQSRHTKASPDFLSSVEFRNTLGRCLTKAQASTAKTFVYINELCTVLKQHSTKRRTTAHTLPPAEEKTQKRTDGEAEGGSPAEVTPSTSGTQDEHGNEGQEEKKTKRASRRQIAYLENLLKVYNDEIKRLQERELSVDDLEEEDSSYIQEHKLKRKMMKIYDKLCELKSCNSLTGRVIEQRISYKGSRHPEINKKIERYINSPEVRWNPPDYRDILQLVQRSNQRHCLSLSRSQLSQIAQDAFQETGRRLQDRRHLDMVYNFGSHLTDVFKPNTDPALSDSGLARKLRTNREVAISSLEEVITKFAMKQGDTEEEERKKRQKANQKKEENTGKVEEEEEKEEEEKEEEEKEDESGGDEEEEEDEDDDVSSDPDIEEEIQASNSQEGDEEDEGNDEPTNASDGENQGSEDLPSVKSSVLDEEEEEEGGGEEEEGTSENDQQSVSSSHRGASTDTSPPEQPTTENPSPSDSPSQSEPVKTNPLEDSQWRSPISPAQPITTNTDSLPPSPAVVSTNQDLLLTPCDTKATNGHPSPPSPVKTDSAWSSRKRRKSVDLIPQTTSSKRHKANSMSGSESDIPLDMGVASSPLQADSTRADSPTQETIDAATQCDPEEVIVLSDSD